MGAFAEHAKVIKQAALSPFCIHGKRCWTGLYGKLRCKRLPDVLQVVVEVAVDPPYGPSVSCYIFLKSNVG